MIKSKFYMSIDWLAPCFFKLICMLRSTRSLSRQSTATLKLKKRKIEIENGNENRIHMANKKQNMHTNKKKKGEHDREVKREVIIL